METHHVRVGSTKGPCRFNDEKKKRLVGVTEPGHRENPGMERGASWQKNLTRGGEPGKKKRPTRLTQRKKLERGGPLCLVNCGREEKRRKNERKDVPQPKAGSIMAGKDDSSD